jgi:hypothetical protein
MFEVQSFLRTDGDFIPVTDFTGEILDPYYIEGAIEIVFQGQELLSFDDSDYVDQLWAYFVKGLHEVAQGKEFSTYFPDHPTQVTFQPDRHCRQVTIEVKSYNTYHASVSYDEFMNTMIAAGKAFYQRMAEIVPESRTFYEDMERQLSSIEWRS